MNLKLEYKLQEADNLMKDYLGTKEMKDYLGIKETEDLTSMCQFCERYCGAQHDYTECKDMPCFRNWLAMVYLCWETSYE